MRKILVIDDNPAIHEDFRKIFNTKKSDAKLMDAAAAFFGEIDEAVDENLPEVELDSALQGEEAFQLVKKSINDDNPYTLAFCDMRMPPGWDGLTTIEKLWEADPHLQVVICSAYSDNTWSEITTRLGRSDRLLILKKPFDNAEVLQLAVALIEKRRLFEKAAIKQTELEQIVDQRTLHLKQAREESERLVQSIDSSLIQIDNDMVIQRWNRGATETFGPGENEAIGQSLEQLPIAWEEPGTLAQIRSSLNKSESTQLEIQIASDSPQPKMVSLTVYPIRENNQSRGLLLIGNDLTEQKIMEQQLRQAQRLESVGQLAAGVAHEINTPMQYLGDNLSYLETKIDKLMDFLQATETVIESESGDDIQAEQLEELRTKAKKMKMKRMYEQMPQAVVDSLDGVKNVSRIVNAMKELSHPGSDQKALVSVNQLLQSAATVSRNEWNYVAELNMELDTRLPEIYGFQGELNQCFLNLIVNAAHAIGDKNEEGPQDELGQITLSSELAEGAVIVRISDTGGGIPEKIRKRIFDPFFTTKSVGKGTGQGLALVHSTVVQKHQGLIDFEVEEGVGTTFVIQLPFAGAELSADPSVADLEVTV